MVLGCRPAHLPSIPEALTTALPSVTPGSQVSAEAVGWIPQHQPGPWSAFRCSLTQTQEKSHRGPTRLVSYGPRSLAAERGSHGYLEHPGLCPTVCPFPEGVAGGGASSIVEHQSSRQARQRLGDTHEAPSVGGFPCLTRGPGAPRGRAQFCCLSPCPGRPARAQGLRGAKAERRWGSVVRSCWACFRCCTPSAPPMLREEVWRRSSVKPTLPGRVRGGRGLSRGAAA